MKSNAKFSNICSIAAAALALLFIGYTAVVNFPLSFEEIMKAFRRETGFTEMTENISAGLKSDELKHKTDLIDLNGLYARATDRVSYNGVIKLINGMLTAAGKKYDVSGRAESVAAFSGALDEAGIPFVFVQAPYKADTEGALLPAGVEDFSNSNADALVGTLEALGVDVLDLRQYTSSTPEQLEYSFYRTDHHWNSRGAFTGFEKICAFLRDNYDSSLDITYTDRGMWTEHVSENCFLGSRGKRVGVYYAGVDDLIWYTPDFETEMSFIVDKHFTYRHGGFEDTVMNPEYIGNRDYHHVNNYCIYIGGDYPLVRHINPGAPNRKKLLVIEDSFTLPVQAFLSTVFYEVDTIDPRGYTEMSICDYVRAFGPDFVVMMITPDADVLKYDSFFSFGTQARANGARETVGTMDLVTVDAADGSRNAYSVFQQDLTPGAVYTMDIASISVDEGSTKAVGFALYSESKKNRTCHRVIDLALDRGENGYSWTFRVPDDAGDYHMIIYAGIPGSTSGNTVACSGCALSLHGQGVSVDRLVIAKRDAQYSYEALPVVPRPGKSYEVEIGDIKVLEGETAAVNVCLYDFNTDTRLQQETIEIGENTPYVIVFAMPGDVDISHKCKLLLYSGEAGKTKGISVEYDDIRVTELDY